MEDLISIIVPVYNSERYLRSCIQSIQEQTYPYFEVLLMDDGSADGSREICEGICETDGRFRFFPLSHKGVSCARNEGMREAKGKYLFFLDSDDEIHPNLLEVLYRLAEKNHAVMSGTGYLLTEENEDERSDKQKKRNHKRRHNSPKTENKNENKPRVLRYTCLKKNEALECFPFEMRDYFFFSIGGKLLLRDAAKRLIFDIRLSNSEDTLFLYRMISNGEDTGGADSGDPSSGGADTNDPDSDCADIVVLHERWYYYRRHGDGASEANSVKSYQNRYDVCRYICAQEKKMGRITNAINWEDFMIRFLLSGRLKDYGAGRKDLDQYFLRIMRELKEEELFPHVRYGTRARFYLARLCLPLYRRLFLTALIFSERRNKEAGLLPQKYMERQIEEVYLQP